MPAPTAVYYHMHRDEILASSVERLTTVGVRLIVLRIGEVTIFPSDEQLAQLHAAIEEFATAETRG